METKLRIAFIKDWHDDLEHIWGNIDGILGAVSWLSEKYLLKFFTRCQVGIPKTWLITNGINYELIHNIQDGSLQEKKYDVLVCWGSLDRPWHSKLPKNIPAILCFAGGPTKHENLKYFNHVLVESKVYEEAFRNQGVSVSRAFGTNTDVFRREARTPKVFDAIYPASFCFHKNQELFARAMGNRGLCVGNWNVLDIVGACLKHNTPVLRRVSSRALCDLYNMSRVTVVPCGPQGGAQRVVLESMACGVPVVLANDNDKCVEFVRESSFGLLVHPVENEILSAVQQLNAYPLDPNMGIQYIRDNWTHVYYGKAIEEAIRKVVDNAR